MMSTEEISRYKRQLLLKEVGGGGQQRLKAARVLIIGAGGLGTPLLLYMAGAGVGHIAVMDGDMVSVDNLQRQIAFKTANVGELKAQAAARAARDLNPLITVEAIPAMLDAGNALKTIAAYDLVADGSDNFATRYLVNDACYFAQKPLVFAALGQYDGYLATFKAYLKGKDGRPMPSYRCLFPEKPAPGTVPNCEEAGILGPVAGVMGSLMAVEVLKQILNFEDNLTARLLIFDALAMRFQTIGLAWDPENPLNGTRPTIHDLSIHTLAAA